MKERIEIIEKNLREQTEIKPKSYHQHEKIRRDKRLDKRIGNKLRFQVNNTSRFNALNGATLKLSVGNSVNKGYQCLDAWTVILTEILQKQRITETLLEELMRGLGEIC